MTTIEKLRTLARELAGEAWDYDRRRLPAQAHFRRFAASAVMNQADSIQHEDAMFEDPPGDRQRSSGSPSEVRRAISTQGDHEPLTIPWPD